MARLEPWVAAACAVTLAVAWPGRTQAATADIVLYTSDVTALQGNWTKAADSSAAGGQKVSSADRGWSTAQSPLASPADYFEATFSAPASTAYHVWVRLRAANDSKWNDSVWLQFSDATDPAGAAAFRIGTAGGLLINLENCNACGMAGWGWQDKGYWTGQSPVVMFAVGGTHTIRVQTREDGVEIDQIVLSPATYLTGAPGQVTNDATIVTNPASPPPAPPAPPAPAAPAAPAAPPGSPSTPFSGTASAIPGTIQAEAFDDGGEGVAYHDITPGNAGGAYRQTDVDLEPASNGGYDIGWIDAGEWLQYSVNVAAAGTYTVQFHVASSGQGGTFHLEMNGTNVTGPLTIPNTGGWQTWQTLSKGVSLGGGPQAARLVMDAAGSLAVGNIDWMQFTAATTLPSVPAMANSPNPPDGTVGVTVTPNLSWKASGATNYDIRLGTANPPPTVVSNATDSWYGPSTLNAGTKYYWQIVASNSSGSTAGPVWSFIAAGTIQTPPLVPPPATGGVAVVTWNVLVNDSSAAHARTAIDYLAALSPQPQVIVIEEGRQTEYNTYISELQNRTGLTWQGVFQTHCPVNAWNGSSCTTSEDEGVGVFTSLPLVSSSAIYLPFADGYHSARAAVRAAVSVNGVTVQVFGLHLQGQATARYSSMTTFRNWASNYSTPQIAAGDFNADPDQIDTSAGMGEAFVDSWSVVGSGRGFTCSTPSPTMKLDYWFADASGKAQPVWSNVVTSTGTLSDHFPVLTYFTVRP